MAMSDKETAAMAAYILENAVKFRQPIIQEMLDDCVTWLKNYQQPQSSEWVSNYPQELNDQLRSILSIPSHILATKWAPLFRHYGHDIPTRMEEEQCYLLHLFITSYLKYGDTWRQELEKSFDDQPPQEPSDG